MKIDDSMAWTTDDMGSTIEEFIFLYQRNEKIEEAIIYSVTKKAFHANHNSKKAMREKEAIIDAELKKLSINLKSMH